MHEFGVMAARCRRPLLIPLPCTPFILSRKRSFIIERAPAFSCFSRCEQTGNILCFSPLGFVLFQDLFRCNYTTDPRVHSSEGCLQTPETRQKSYVKFASIVIWINIIIFLEMYQINWKEDNKMGFFEQIHSADKFRKKIFKNLGMNQQDICRHFEKIKFDTDTGTDEIFTSRHLIYDAS